MSITTREFLEASTLTREHIDRFLDPDAHNYATFDSELGYVRKNSVLKDGVDERTFFRTIVFEAYTHGECCPWTSVHQKPFPRLDAIYFRHVRYGRACISWTRHGLSPRQQKKSSWFCWVIQLRTLFTPVGSVGGLTAMVTVHENAIFLLRTEWKSAIVYEPLEVFLVVSYFHMCTKEQKDGHWRD